MKLEELHEKDSFLDQAEQLVAAGQMRGHRDDYTPWAQLVDRVFNLGVRVKERGTPIDQNPYRRTRHDDQHTDPRVKAREHLRSVWRQGWQAGYDRTGTLDDSGVKYPEFTQ